VPDRCPRRCARWRRASAIRSSTAARRLLDLGLSYLTLDRAASTLSTGERQRMQLARAVRNRTTGVLYVLDEPSIGLHPANIEGLNGVMHDLVADGNSVVLVDHDTQILSEADWMIEMGPRPVQTAAASSRGHRAERSPINESSLIGPFLAGRAHAGTPRHPKPTRCFRRTAAIHLSTGRIHTVKPLESIFRKGS
jgi:excinuclease ABC subunit A